MWGGPSPLLACLHRELWDGIGDGQRASLRTRDNVECRCHHLLVSEFSSRRSTQCRNGPPPQPPGCKVKQRRCMGYIHLPNCNDQGNARRYMLTVPSHSQSKIQFVQTDRLPTTDRNCENCELRGAYSRAFALMRMCHGIAGTQASLEDCCSLLVLSICRCKAPASLTALGSPNMSAHTPWRRSLRSASPAS